MVVWCCISHKKKIFFTSKVTGKVDIQDRCRNRWGVGGFRGRFGGRRHQVLCGGFAKGLEVCTQRIPWNWLLPAAANAPIGCEFVPPLLWTASCIWISIILLWLKQIWWHDFLEQDKCALSPNIYFSSKRVPKHFVCIISWDGIFIIFFILFFWLTQGWGSLLTIS